MAVAAALAATAGAVRPASAQEALRDQYRLPVPPVQSTDWVPRTPPGTSAGSPSAFGAGWGDVFAGLGFQQRTRFTDDEDGAVLGGIGLGDPTRWIGVELTATSFSTVRQGFGRNGGLSVKLHRRVADAAAVAVGYENAVTWGAPDGGNSLWGAMSNVFVLRPSPARPFSRITATLGVGNGRFRSESDVREDEGTVNPFASVAVRVLEPLALIADWTGQDLALGLSYVVPGVELVISPAFVDVTGTAGDGARFTLGVGYGLRLDGVE